MATDWSAASKKAWETRRANDKKKKLSESAKKAVATRLANKEKASPTEVKSTRSKPSWNDVEDGLDNIFFMLKDLGDNEMADEVRQTRRKVCSKLLS